MSEQSCNFQIDDENSICFDRGKFDNFCVYFNTYSKNKILIEKRAVKDIELINNLVLLKDDYKEKTYKLIEYIYKHTNNKINYKLIEIIINIIKNNFDNSLRASKYFLFVYYAMVAEENKRGSKLGKRIKLLGIYQVLIEGISPLEASNFSKGLKWITISNHCKKRGF